MTKASRLITTLSLLAVTHLVHAVPVLWDALSGGNGHSYEVIVASAGITWDDAKAAAEARGGHLATVTSDAENTFIHGLTVSTAGAWANDCCNSFGPWLGGIQPPGSAEPDGGWTWVTGELWSYTNWGGGLNNAFANGPRPENALHYFGFGNDNFVAVWNDFPSDEGRFVRSYVVEFSSTSVPEPLSVSLLGLGLGVFAFRRRPARCDA